MRTENKQFKKVLSVILSICMLLSIVPSMVFAEGSETGWTQDEATNSTGCVNELVDGWVHLKSGPNNGNAATGTTPAVFVSDTMTGGKFGTVNLAIKPVSGPTETRFGVYLNYENPNNGYFIGYDAGGWFWQRYGDDGSYKSVGIDAPEAGEQVILKITWSDNTITSATVDGQSIFGGSTVDISYTTGDKIAIKCGTYNSQYTDIYVCDADNIPEETTEPTSSTEAPEVPADPDRETFTLTNDAMNVTVDAKFPRVIKYDLANGDVVYGQTKTLDTIRINGVDLTVDPEKVVTTEAADKVTYKFPLKSADNTIDMEMTCELVIDNNTLAFNITEIKNNLDSQVNPILKIYIPQHSLVSVNANDEASNLFGAIISSKTSVDGDEYFKLTSTSANKTTEYAYAVISDSKISASMESNSTVDGKSNGFGGAGANNTRIVSEVYDGAVPNAEGTYETVKTLGLQSNTWDYQYRVTTNVGSATNTTTYVYDHVDMPYVRVVITGDENKDGAINWNDGAIAFRDISHEIAKSDEVPELVGYRISMNFGGQAQNPFLTTLDNVKRVAANTDGLGQSILLKGYASEGHDSGHPDYWNIGERIGGAEDMNTLLTKGKEYGAVFGIHVNASEFYPEAKAFNENRIKWNGTGTPNYGWNWIDQGINMNGWYDMANYDPDAKYDELYRENRFQKLYDLVGENLDFVYVDVWGNGQTPSDGTWGTRVISKEITERGWRMANEWGVANDWDATFTHWATDLTYGGANLKGVNSTLIRFIRNHQKDVWVGDYPSYGGEAQAPLLGGMNMKDFEGWQGRNDYDAWIRNLYTHNLSTKFLQHFKVVSWEYANDTDSTVPTSADWTPSVKAVLRDDAGNEVVVTRKSGNPSDPLFRERVITFNGIKVLDGSENRGDNDSSKGNQTYLIPWLWDSSTGEFLDSKDEKLYHWNTAGGTTTWTLPQSWSDVSEVKYYKLTDLGAVEEQIIKVDENRQITINADAETPYIVKKGDATKLEIVWSEGMHIVDAGFNSGIDNILSLWDVEKENVKYGDVNGDKVININDASLVQLYINKNEGTKVDENIADVNRDGIITVADVTAIQLIATGRTEAPTVSGTATVQKSQYSNPMFVLNGEISAKQELTDLTAGTQYAVYLGVDNRSDNNAYVRILDSNGNVVAENYTNRSIAKNYIKAYTHSNSSATIDGTSYFQNIYLFFTPVDGEKYYLQLEQTGTGNVYFDDIRITESDASFFKYDEEGNVTSFYNDFEKNVQGVYPFVIGGIEGVEDNRTHLSELHKPYTQAGWDIKKLDDVIAGDWSVKVNGLVQRNAMVMQTIPQNFRFEPGVTYDISFDYEIGTAGTYGVVYGEGEYNSSKPYSLLPLNEQAITGGGTSKHSFSFSLIGGESGQTWFGIYSTSKAPENTDSFIGYKDLVIDNVSIKVSKSDKSKMMAAYEKYSGLNEVDYAPEQWAVFAEALANVEALFQNSEATQEEVDAATKALIDAAESLEVAYGTITVTVKNAEGNPIEGAKVALDCYNDNTIAKQTGVADANGMVRFENLRNREYGASASADGYTTRYGVTAPITVNEVTNTDVVLNTVSPDGLLKEYNFDDGDVSMLVSQEDNAGGNVTVTAVDGAAKLNFPGGGRANVFVEADDLDRVKNGRIEFDITTVSSSGARFGVNLRGANFNQRIFLGVENSVAKYFWEWWNGGSSSYSSLNTKTAYLTQGNTVHVVAEIKNNTVKLKMNDEVVLNSTIGGNIPSAGGWFGFECQQANSFMIDNVKIYTNDTDPVF